MFNNNVLTILTTRWHFTVIKYVRFSLNAQNQQEIEQFLFTLSVGG